MDACENIRLLSTAVNRTGYIKPQAVDPRVIYYQSHPEITVSAMMEDIYTLLDLVRNVGIEGIDLAVSKRIRHALVLLLMSPFVGGPRSTTSIQKLQLADGPCLDPTCRIAGCQGNRVTELPDGFVDINFMHHKNQRAGRTRVSMES